MCYYLRMCVIIHEFLLIYYKNIIFWVFYFAYSAFGTWFDFDPKLFEDITSPND